MPEEMEADECFVLMTDRYRVSRNTRARWFFDHINKLLTPSSCDKLDDFTQEIQVVSMLPKNYQDLLEEDSSDSSGGGPFKITHNTKVTFLARRYRLVFILDLSPSMTTVDTQCNRVLYDEVFTALSRSLRGLAQPFFVPGSRLLFTPEMFVTVLAHTPFFTSEGQQVVAQGWKLTAENVTDFISLLKIRFNEITDSVAKVTARANEELDDKLSGGKRISTPDNFYLDNLFYDGFEGGGDDMASSLSIPPDIAMVNMYRCGLLALQLLPPQSNAGIVMISDGMLTLSSASILESMLTQSRNHNISCSFLQVGSPPHPHSCFGYLPYTDLMKFITTATFGAYLDRCPEEKKMTTPEFNYSMYHRAFLAWNFQRGLHGFKADVHWDAYRRKDDYWSVDNPYFYSVADQVNRFPTDYDHKKDQDMVKHKLHGKTRLKLSFTSVLSCRLREGYTIKNVAIYPATKRIEVSLILPWKHNVNIEYILGAPWTDGQPTDTSDCTYEINYEGSYWFLHDVTCLAKNRNITSGYRWTAIQQFWSTLKSLTDADNFLVHLTEYSHRKREKPSSGSNIEIPDSVKCSRSLFILSPDSNELVTASENSAFHNLSHYWKKICLLDINVWHKWMHTHRINLILEHDLPLPSNLHFPADNRRYYHVQCLKAMAALSSLLRDYSSFVLLENHSYIKFTNM